jgi:hypothetical protein
MPSFYSAALNGFPPTPPHVNLSGRLESDPAFYASNCPGFPMRYGDYTADKYSQPSCYPNPTAPVSGRPLSLLPGQHCRDLAAGPKAIVPHHVGHPPSIYGPVNTVNILPPIRTSTKLPSMDSAVPPQYRRHDPPVQIEQQQQQRPKEEKSTGGVAAHLDYEMDQMSDFVAEMAQGMYALYTSKLALSDIDLIRSIYPGTTVTPQFRKYVLQILSSTRLPSSTILLGLYYLAARVRMLSAADIYTSGNSHLYRMLTISLILGSKFLDDNTFQNRSWAEVSNIPVAELNGLELEWLFGFDWKIHERIHDKQDGFMTWRAHWDTWRVKASVRAHDSRVKLSPIDTGIQRHHHRPVQTPMLSPDGPIPPQYQSATWMSAMSSDYSPPSAPHSGPNTPDYYQAAPWPYGNAPPPYSRNWPAAPPPQYSHTLNRSQPPSYHHTPAYSQPFSPPVWTGHGSSCGCPYCAKHQENYLPSMHFGIQPVAG